MSPVGTLRHTDGYPECLLIGINRKWLAHGLNDEIDPQRTFDVHLPSSGEVLEFREGQLIAVMH